MHTFSIFYAICAPKSFEKSYHNKITLFYWKQKFNREIIKKDDARQEFARRCLPLIGSPWKYRFKCMRDVLSRRMRRCVYVNQ